MKTLIVSLLMIGFGTMTSNCANAQERIGGIEDASAITQEFQDNSSAPERRCYYRPNDGTYSILKDGDGYLVRKPDGSEDAWGNGYTWSDVLEGYRLKSNMQTNC